MFKVSSAGLHARPQPLSKTQYCLVDWTMQQIGPCQQQVHSLTTIW